MKDKILKEYDKKFKRSQYVKHDDIKQFISDAIDRVKQDTLNELNVDFKWEKDIRKDVIKEILDELPKEIEIDVDVGNCFEVEESREAGYNMCLEEITNLLKGKL